MHTNHRNGDFPPPVALTRRVLSIRRQGDRLILATPIGRHALVGLLCLFLPILFWALQVIGARKSGSGMSARIEHPWLAFIVDYLLPDPLSVPWQMNLIALGFVLIGVVWLGHRLVAIVDLNGVTAIHSFCFVPYWRAQIARCDIRSFTLGENGRLGETATLYCLWADCLRPPHIKFCGFHVKAPESRQAHWQEWLVYSLPGEEAAKYVLGLLQAACPLDTPSAISKSR